MLIDTASIEKFFESKLFEEMRAAPELHREVRFNMFYPASELTDQAELKESLENESVLVQGVIDCFFKNRDGSMTVVDYKTDHFAGEDLKNRDAVRQTLVQRHQRQLSYYRKACETLTGCRVSRLQLYSFALGEAVDLETESELQQ